MPAPVHPERKHRPATLIPLLAVVLALVPLGCDGLSGAEVTCLGQSEAPGARCSQSLQGIPPFPPPPCWNEAGEIQSDEVCARVHEESGNAGEEGEKGEDGDGGLLPGPPALPE